MTWQRVRNDVNDVWHTLPTGVVGPFFNDRFGDVFGIIYGFTADGFTHRELRDYVEQVRSEPSTCRTSPRSTHRRPGRGDLRRVLDAGAGQPRHRPLGLLAAIRTQNDVRPAGIIETGDERISLRVTGAFRSEQDLLDINFVAGGHDPPERHRERGAATPTRRSRCSGSAASRRSRLGIAMRDGGDVLALGDNIDMTLARIQADLPIGIEPHLVANQPVTVETAIGEFMESLWQAVAIILGMSFLSLGMRPGLVVALAIPLTLAIVFAIMLVFGIDMQRINWVPDHRARADGRRRDDHDRRHADQARRRRRQACASMHAFKTYAVAMLAGTLMRSRGLRRSASRRARPASTASRCSPSSP